MNISARVTLLNFIFWTCVCLQLSVLLDFLSHQLNNRLVNEVGTKASQIDTTEKTVS